MQSQDSRTRISNVRNNLRNAKDVITRLMSLGNSPGLSVALLCDGELVLSEGYGCADIANRKPATPETIYPIASITKPFAAIACGLLVSDKNLSWGEMATLVDALSHRTGLADQVCFHLGPNGQPMFDNREGLISVVNAMPCGDDDFRKLWRYNPLLYTLIGLVIEKSSSQSLEQFLLTRIFEPLDMRSTSFIQSTPSHATHCAGEAHVARPYAATRNGEFILRDVTPTAYEFPFNAPMGIQSTVVDMVQFARAIIDGYQSQRGGNPRVLPIPHVGANERKKKILFHSGTGNGFVSSLHIYPETADAVVVLANSSFSGNAANSVAVFLTCLLNDFSIDIQALEGNTKACSDYETDRWSVVERRLKKERATQRSGDAPRADDIAGVYKDEVTGLVLRIEKQDSAVSAYANMPAVQYLGVSIKFGVVTDVGLPLWMWCENTLCFLPGERDYQLLGMGYLNHWCQFYFIFILIREAGR
ncbi:beta-lactamase/transpeptidase-like protein [Apiosordaria backusii]|uniref:Beta-lactamase/transpeptidase-like protein n=1 Tax=Apiosordaria backusii TaxID=314023 RepID=A0AA40DFS7_9PEZI|nr:beta-lactamase/transpeptidase-like protein [Apiosordaria backusii]